jgi:hypothetical protein
MHTIHVVFISHPPLEIPVITKHMNTLAEEKGVGEISARNDSLPAGVGSPDPATSRLSEPGSIDNNWPLAANAEALLTKTRYAASPLGDSRCSLSLGSGRCLPGAALKQVVFSLAMPGAAMVQLAADFTDWEQSPINMIRFEDGCWSTTVPLPAGVYAYSFLVDGQWFDDSRAARLTGGSSCAVKSFIQVK